MSMRTNTNPGALPQAWTDWAAAITAGVLQAQQLQIEAMLSWQAAMAATGAEAWDEWRCRFAGGAPFDV